MGHPGKGSLHFSSLQRGCWETGVPPCREGEGQRLCWNAHVARQASKGSEDQKEP